MQRRRHHGGSFSIAIIITVSATCFNARHLLLENIRNPTYLNQLPYIAQFVADVVALDITALFVLRSILLLWFVRTVRPDHRFCNTSGTVNKDYRIRCHGGMMFHIMVRPPHPMSLQMPSTRQGKQHHLLLGPLSIVLLHNQTLAVPRCVLLHPKVDWLPSGTWR